MPETSSITKEYLSEFMNAHYRYDSSRISGREFEFFQKLVPAIGKKLGYENVSFATPNERIMTYDLMSDKEKLATFACAALGGKGNMLIGIESTVLPPEKIHETLDNFLKGLDTGRESLQ